MKIHRHVRHCWLTCICLALSVNVAWAASASFQGLGTLGAGTIGQPTALSADGRTVVGYSETRDPYNRLLNSQAWRWTPAGGLASLGQATDGMPYSKATGVSSDGSAVVGQNFSAAASVGFHLHAGQTTFLDDPTSIGGTSATGISADGSVVLGGGWHKGEVAGFPVDQPHACVWTRQGASWTATYLPDVEGDNDTVVRGSSPDGTYLVGRGTWDGSSVGVLWQKIGEQYEATNLWGPMGGGLNATAVAVTPNGRTVIGGGQRCSGYTGVYWTWDASATGYLLTQIQDMPGGVRGSDLHGLSADGRWAVGNGFSATGQQVAALWDGLTGKTINLQDMLISQGLGDALQGWTLSVATAITPDGTTIVGYGVNPAGQTDAWIATVPEPLSIALLAIATVTACRRQRS